MRINVELDTAQAVTPGQGQTVQVAGVRDRRHRRASSSRTAARSSAWTSSRSTRRSSAATRRRSLRPRTGLKDMYVQVFPGKDRAPVEGGLHDPDRQLADRRRPRRDPLRARRAHPRLHHAAGQRRRRGPARQGRRPRARARALRPDGARPRPRQPRGRQGARSRCAASSRRWRRSTASWPSARRTSRASSPARRPRCARSPARTTTCATPSASSRRRCRRRRPR